MIKAKVADLLDARTLVLNKGINAGVKRGMYFMIYASDGRQIIDPDTKEILGILPIPRVAVRITKVEEAYSVAETYKFKTVNEGGMNTTIGSISGYFAPPKYVKKYQTFEIDNRKSKSIDQQKSIVKIGDMAEQFEENDAINEGTDSDSNS